MFRTFSLGVVLGVVGAGALLHFVPAVDQGRERSITSVMPNGGNREAFHINLPADRILAGRAGADVTVPPGIDWPDSSVLADSRTELFKVRNDEERVVGVASRIMAEGSQPFVEWAVHIPARGTLYVLMNGRTTAPGDRAGSLRAGTREFAEMRGSVVERYIAGAGDDRSEYAGRLELVTALVGPEGAYDETMGDDGMDSGP